MSLIITQISRFGIIHASDSNLTGGGGSAAGEGQKTFSIPRLKSGLTLAGSYSVNETRMDLWMRSFIQTHTSNTLAEFAEKLRDELDQQMSPIEKANGTLIHIAGYAKTDGFYHPELWYIRNASIDPSTGEYIIGGDLQLTEDFWIRDCPRYGLMNVFQQGGYQLYVNGFASGRTSFMLLQPAMQEFFNQVWSNKYWKFRPPGSLKEAKLLVTLYVKIISILFQLSDYSAPFIGGRAQTYGIRQPTKIARSC